MNGKKYRNKLFLDFGNWDVKFVTGSGDKSHFRHALARLQPTVYRNLVRNGLPPDGIAEVNGTPYAYGEAARRHQQIQKAGAQRYQPDYYGVIMAIALAEAYQQSADNVFLFATHAPRDLRYQRDIRRAVAGEWDVTTSDGHYTFRIHPGAVATLDEPLGGLNHYMLTDRGNERRTPLKNQTVLVIDVGGLTTDIVPVDPGGKIDVTAMGSTEVGAINLYRQFEEGVRSRYHDQFRNVTVIDRDRLERFLLTGVWQYGTAELDVQREAKEAINLVMNDVVDIIQRYGGIANYDAFLLTGGGAVLILDALREAFPYARIELAEPNRDDMRYANILGARKFARLLEAEGIL